MHEEAQELEQLKAIIHNRMLAFPYAAPHPETVEAIANGLLAAIDVSNARPGRYADEPWLNQGALVHAEHCESHAMNAMHGTTNASWWTSDIDQPEIAHACLRSMMCLHQFKKGKL